MNKYIGKLPAGLPVVTPPTRIRELQDFLEDASLYEFFF